MADQAFSWLTAGTPVWLTLLLIAACGGVLWQTWKIVKRMDRHAESIAHMDEWADSVDQTLAQIEERSRRFMPASTSAPRSTVDLKKWWQK